MGRLNQYSGPVSSLRIRAGCPPVGKPVQGLQTLFDDAVGFLSLHIADKTHSAGVVFKTRVIQTVFF